MSTMSTCVLTVCSETHPLSFLAFSAWSGRNNLTRKQLQEQWTNLKPSDSLEFCSKIHCATNNYIKKSSLVWQVCSKLPLCCSRNTKSQKDKENCSINHNKLQDIHFPSLPHFSKNKLVRAHWNVKYRHYFIVLRAPHLFPSSFSSYKHGYKLKKKKSMFPIAV